MIIRLNIVLAVMVFSLVFLPILSAQEPTEEQMKVREGVGPDILTLTFSGDIMAHDNNFKMKDFNEIYQDVREVLLADDLSFGNLEFAVDPTLPYSTYPRFNVHPAYVEAAIQGGFDVFTMANNHSNDQFASGMRNGRQAMRRLQEKYPIAFTGIHDQPLRGGGFADWEMLVLEKKGLKIGFIGMTALSQYEHCQGTDPIPAI
jgi:poly-gamma-glutamate capsule biosynthesis protein CapA/YwtB (metallophosphatase superfamily)